MAEKNETGHGIEQSIMPGRFRTPAPHLRLKIQRPHDRSQGVVRNLRQQRSGHCQRVDPWAEAMKGKSPQESLLRRGSVRHNHRPTQPCLQLRPERSHAGCLLDFLIINPMQLARTRTNGTRRTNEAAKKICRIPKSRQGNSHPHLHRLVHLASPRPGAFEVQRRQSDG